MPYVIIATWRVRPGSEDAVAAILRKLTVATRLEPGCRFYQAQASVEFPDVYVVYEIYDDKAAAEAHTASNHFRELVLEQAVPLLESRERQLLETLSD